MFLTSHDKLGNSDRKTGFWLEEFAAPFYVFKDAGAQIVLASPLGGILVDIVALLNRPRSELPEFGRLRPMARMLLWVWAGQSTGRTIP
jgi:putative intracellular protease/amidase